MEVQKLIKEVKEKYPLSVHFKGFVTEEEQEKLEEYCTVHCPSVYMDGSCVLSIRYKKES